MAGAMSFFRLQLRLCRVLLDSDCPGPWGRGCLEAGLGGIKLFDALHLRRLIVGRRPREILEVGTYLGFSACWLSEQAGPGVRVTSVDPRLPHRGFQDPGLVARRLARETGADLELVTAFFGPAPAGAAAPGLGAEWERRFDFIFIDGDHAYDCVLANFALALHLLRPGGCIALHDALSWPGVWLAVRHLGKIHSEKGSMRIIGGIPLPFLQDGLAVFEAHA